MRYITILLVAAMLFTGCGRPPEPDAFTNSIYWIQGGDTDGQEYTTGLY